MHLLLPLTILDDDDVDDVALSTLRKEIFLTTLKVNFSILHRIPDGEVAVNGILITKCQRKHYSKKASSKHRHKLKVKGDSQIMETLYIIEVLHKVVIEGTSSMSVDSKGAADEQEDNL